MDSRRDSLNLLRQVAAGEVAPEEALLSLKRAPFEDLGYAKVDLHRGVRQGAAEVIYGAGKTAEQIAGIAAAMGARGCGNILITRMDSQTAAAVGEAVPLEYSQEAKLGVAFPRAVPRLGKIVVAAAGTSDIPVAEEAALTAEAMGNRVVRLYDVGVAGLHRLLSRLDELMDARCVVAVAGMEGALASVIGGLVDCPVVAVPTSVGYGASFGGLSALLAMLNSCASGCSVVNIDNGFGAGYLASRINQMEGLKEP
ncbi:nickel pincer cofactor biosynthesis protein LarB [Pseudoflavonifractor sp. 524-17]|uniref:nickel pincer cofactor biosynthesis protein LarB n=1 Tax=Pseudoflavonifractor sp. 524-17 TaxID=2304577 RepID=UPI00137AD8D0|nr:nickel pincer cofactor biosynthesis protein LarB [Pseudoflavonifractor sp. 524-17]NCE66303.1 nickel pincer cofactor biosynthesis protein LarB [Pseudoflavonifractor sp. 524-17]